MIRIIMKKILITIIIGLKGGLGCLYGDSWIFATEEEAKNAFPNKTISSSVIVDPSYDQTFKRVMSTDTDKVKYLMSFLNSIYYPEARENDLMIRKIEALDKENTSIGKSSGAGIKICDIACKCTAYSIGVEDSRKRRIDEVGETFNVEMQRSPEVDFIMRLVNYGEILRQKHKIPVKGLGLLNYPVKTSYQDESKCYALCEIDPATNTPTRLIGKKNILEANTIDLRKFAPNASEKEEKEGKEEIHINGKKLGIIGVTWLKLLGIKQWNSPTGKTPIKYNIFYPESIDDNIKGVIDILSNIDQETLEQIERQQTSSRNILEGAKAEGAEIQIIKSAKKMIEGNERLEFIAKYSGLTKEIFEKHKEELNLTTEQTEELMSFLND